MDFDLAKSCAVINLAEQLTCVTVGRRWGGREGAIHSYSLVRWLRGWSFQLVSAARTSGFSPPLLTVMCFASGLLAGSCWVSAYGGWLGMF